MWATAGFQNTAPDALARLAGQAWLLIHGVPLLLDTVGVGLRGASRESGVLSLIPLGLTLIPFLLAWRAGRRLARASYTDQLWQALLGSWLMYAAFGLTTGFVCRTDDVGVGLWSAALIPLIPFGLGMVIGARREAGSWSRLIGVDAVAWLSRTSQHSRWAGSYLGSAIKAGFVALMASLAMSCALLAATFFIHWNLVIAVYEALDAGATGRCRAHHRAARLPAQPGGVCARLDLRRGRSPWASAPRPGRWAPPSGRCRRSRCLRRCRPGRWTSGSRRWWCRSSPEPWPAGGSCAKGENHFDEWLSIKIRARWFTATVSTLALGVMVGCVAGLLAAGLAWLARGSAGIGRLTEIGPDPLRTALFVAAEVGIGVVIGYAAGPWLERQQKLREADLETASL